MVKNKDFTMALTKTKNEEGRAFRAHTTKRLWLFNF